VPSGLERGLPVAVSFWGTAGSERTLVEVAHGYELLRDPLPAPTFPDVV
jgi:amidase